MNKILKIFFLCAALLVIALACVATWLYTSGSAQTSLVNKALKSSFEQANVESFKASFSGATLKGLTLPLPDGSELKLQDLEVEIQLSKLLSKSIDIKSLNAKSIVYILPKETEQSAKSVTASAPAATEQTAKSESKAKEAQTSTPEASKKFDWNINIENLSADAKILSPKGESLTLNLEGKNLTVENGMPKALYLKLTGDVKADKLEKSFALNSSLSEKLLGKTKLKYFNLVLESGSQTLLQASAELNEAFSDGNFELRLDADKAQVDSFTMGKIKLPDFKSTLYAKGEFKDFGKSAKAFLKTTNSASNFGDINAALSELGKLGLDGEISLEKTDSIISANKLDIFLIHGERNLATISGPQTFSMDISGKAKMPSGELVKISINGLQPELVNKFTGEIKFGFDEIFSAFNLVRTNDGILQLTGNGIVVNSFSMAKGKEKVIERLNFIITPAFSYFQSGDADAKLRLHTADDSHADIELNATKRAEVYNLNLQASGMLKPILSRVNSISSINLPNVELNAKAEASYKNDIANLKILNLSLLESQKKILEVKSQNLSFNKQDNSLRCENNLIMKFDADKVPFALFKTFVPEMDADEITLNGAITSPKTNNYNLDADLKCTRIYYTKNAERLIADIDLSASLAAKFADGKLSAKMQKAIVSAASTPFAHGEANVSMNKDFAFESADFKLSTQLPVLLSQPVLLKFNNLSKGSVYMEGSANAQSAKAKLLASNLTLRSNGTLIDSVNADVSANFNADFSKINLVSKISADSPKGSTKAEAKLEVSKQIDLVFDSESVSLEDLMSLAAAFQNPNYEAAKSAQSAQTPASAPKKKIGVVRPDEAKPQSSTADNLNVLKADSIAVKDTKAFWYFGKDFNAKAKIKKILKDAKVILSNLELELKATETTLSSPKLYAKVFDAPLAGSCLINFDKNAEVPYTMNKTALQLQGFQVSKIFDNAAKPPMEGVFDASIQLEGRGNNAEHLVQYLTGNATLVGQNGVLRILDEDSVSGKGTAVAGTAIKIVGKVLNNRVKELEGLGEIVTLMNEIKYDLAKVNISRTSKDYNIVISDSGVQTPTLIFAIDTGTIYFDPNANIKEYKIDIPVQMFVAEGRVQKLFDGLNFAKEKSTLDGFYTGPLFKVGGTVGAPTNNLMELLSGTIPNTGGKVLNGIFNLLK